MAQTRRWGGEGRGGGGHRACGRAVRVPAVETLATTKVVDGGAHAADAAATASPARRASGGAGGSHPQRRGKAGRGGGRREAGAPSGSPPATRRAGGIKHHTGCRAAWRRPRRQPRPTGRGRGDALDDAGCVRSLGRPTCRCRLQTLRRGPAWQRGGGRGRRHRGAASAPAAPSPPTPPRAPNAQPHSPAIPPKSGGRAGATDRGARGRQQGGSSTQRKTQDK
ncbi:hypothetical protein BU14_0501s0003 [Porphyra umbilicalis]|uniref:Uncharacterized protein n=1 Tax=Porphyra umbilicalis TaxID=2786 RepID=A0A1X6NT52_PORUM|nr:hypothetical protein BU14_0501s0003 [Porphyra umbilicalis]|eukprot:OSX71784.1 hypothetical protein BU14_0501s0003 [Porphyra umbilicalis]